MSVFTAEGQAAEVRLFVQIYFTCVPPCLLYKQLQLVVLYNKYITVNAVIPPSGHKRNLFFFFFKLHEVTKK